MKLSEAVRGVSGTLAADGEFSCIAFATEQEQSQFLTFLEKEKFLPALDNSKISCVLTTSALAEKIPISKVCSSVTGPRLHSLRFTTAWLAIRIMWALLRLLWWGRGAPSVPWQPLTVKTSSSETA